MSRLFSAYVIVDWSAAAKPTTGADSIWIGVLKRERDLAPADPDREVEQIARLRQLAIDPSLVDQGETEIKAPSSKLDALVPLLQEAANEGHRVLVFSQFTR